MIPLSLDEVRELAAGALETAPWATEVTGLQTDSRRIEEGDLFVAVGGGADFTKHAFARGAAATLVPDDAFAALAALAGRVRDRSSARFVAITGSMGKTSTKDILAAICSPQRLTVAAERSYNAEIGVPLTIGRVEPDTEIVILELAMRGFGQIAELCAFARPDVGVITNVGPVHLAQVGDLAGVARAKGELIEALPAGGIAVVPADFPVARGDLEVIRVGEARRARPTAAADALWRARGQLHCAPPRPECADRARDGERARRRDARAPRRRIHGVAEPGASAAGRRRPDQRRLEREPRLDARRARASRRARRRRRTIAEPRRQGGALRLLAEGHSEVGGPRRRSSTRSSRSARRSDAYGGRHGRHG
jgi:hypothetical protein